MAALRPARAQLPPSHSTVGEAAAAAPPSFSASAGAMLRFLGPGFSASASHASAPAPSRSVDAATVAACASGGMAVDDGAASACKSAVTSAQLQPVPPAAATFPASGSMTGSTAGGLGLSGGANPGSLRPSRTIESFFGVRPGPVSAAAPALAAAAAPSSLAAPMADAAALTSAALQGGIRFPGVNPFLAVSGTVTPVSSAGGGFIPAAATAASAAPFASDASVNPFLTGHVGVGAPTQLPTAPAAFAVGAPFSTGPAPFLSSSR